MEIKITQNSSRKLKAVLRENGTLYLPLNPVRSENTMCYHCVLRPSGVVSVNGSLSIEEIWRNHAFAENESTPIYEGDKIEITF